MSQVFFLLSHLLVLCLATQSVTNPQDSATSTNPIILYSNDLPILCDLFFNQLASHLSTGLELIIFTGAEAEWEKIQSQFKNSKGSLPISHLNNLNGKELDEWTVSDVQIIWSESLGLLLHSFQLLLHFGVEFDCAKSGDKKAFLQSFLPKDLPSDYPEVVSQGRQMIGDLFAKMDHSKLDPNALKFFQMVAFPSSVSIVVSRKVFYCAFAISLLLLTGNLGFLVLLVTRKKSHPPFK